MLSALVGEKNRLQAAKGKREAISVLLATVLAVEALDATGGIDHLLLTRPEGVGERADRRIDDVVGNAFNFAGLAALHGRASDELVLTVDEDDVVVFWVCIFFHD